MDWISHFFIIPYIVIKQSIDLAVVRLKIDNLCNLNLFMNQDSTISLIKEIFTDYISENSIFQKFDKEDN